MEQYLYQNKKTPYLYSQSILSFTSSFALEASSPGLNQHRWCKTWRLNCDPTGQDAIQQESGQFQQLSKCTARLGVVTFRACKQASIIHGGTRVEPAHAVTSECAEPLHNMSVRREQRREAKEADQVALQSIYNCWCHLGSATNGSVSQQWTLLAQKARGRRGNIRGRIKAALYQIYWNLHHLFVRDESHIWLCSR